MHHCPAAPAYHSLHEHIKPLSCTRARLPFQGSSQVISLSNQPQAVCTNNC